MTDIHFFLRLCENYLEIIKHIGSGLYGLDDKRTKIHEEIIQSIYDWVHPDNFDGASFRVSEYLHDLPENVTAKEMQDYIYDIVEKNKTSGIRIFRSFLDD